MTEFNRVLPPIISDTSRATTNSATPSLAPTGHLHTAQGDKTVTQLKTGGAVPITTKPPAEPAPSTVQRRVATVSPIPSPEQVARDTRTLKEAGDFVRGLRENPEKAVNELKTRLLNEKSN